MSDFRLTSDVIMEANKETMDTLFKNIRDIIDTGYGISNLDMFLKNTPASNILDENGCADITIRIEIKKENK